MGFHVWVGQRFSDVGGDSVTQHRCNRGPSPVVVRALVENLEQRVCLSSALAVVQARLLPRAVVQPATVAPKLLIAATHFSLVAPTSISAGTPFTVTVSALDSQNRGVATYGGTVHFSSSDPSAVLPADYTFAPGPDGDAGSADFTVTLANNGPQEI